MSKYLSQFIEGEPCRKCETPIVKRVPKCKKGQTRTRAKDRQFYYAYYYWCSGCRTIYMPEDGKRDFIKGQRIFEVLD